MSTVPNQVGPETAGRLVEITRVFDAPRSLVFRAWTDAEHLERWYAPQGCSTPFCAMDPRVGGVVHICIRSPEGLDCWCAGTILEFVPPERLVYTLSFSDPDGNLVDTPPPIGDHSGWPRATVVTLTFEDLDRKTRLTLHQSVLESLARRTGAYPSWLSMLDRLGELLAEA
jgi:uncharacterized protein YndB with AHSA1/START domain